MAGSINNNATYAHLLPLAVSLARHDTAMCRKFRRQRLGDQARAMERPFLIYTTPHNVLLPKGERELEQCT
jgi:hypothetical protein